MKTSTLTLSLIPALLVGLPNGDRGWAQGPTLLSAQGRVPLELSRLVRAYSDFIQAVDQEAITFRNGKRLDWREGADRLVFLLRTPPTYEEQLRLYPIREFDREKLTDWFDETHPGRRTFYEILGEIYGRTPAEVWNNLRIVRFMPRTLNLRLRFNARNGAARALEAVGRELDLLPSSFHRYLRHATTYVERPIRGTRLRSLHALGIAIDLNPAYGDYWRWAWNAAPGNSFAPRNRIPREIVQIFEKHGFLWGGRWYLFDTIHFEYRPELFLDS